MSDLLKSPAVIVGVIVLVVAVALLGQGSGPTYATTSGPSAADMKAQAEGQAAMDSTLNAGRKDLLDSLLGYQKTQLDYRTSILKIRTDAETTRYTTDAGVTLGLAGIDAQNRATDSEERIAQNTNQTNAQIADGQQATERQNGVLGFFGNLLGFIGKLVLGA